MAAVQALPLAHAVHTPPASAPAPFAVPMTAPWGAGALHQHLNAFVKKTLIQQLVPAGAVVCDLFCGRGVDTENWAEAHIGKYVGVDLSSSALEDAKEQWEKSGKPFPASFCELNPCMLDLENHLEEDRLSADVVTCLAHLQDCFVSEEMVHQLLLNVSSLLKPGGYFFGAVPDSSTIWYKYQKAVEGAMKAGSLRAHGQLPRVKTELYSISFEDDRKALLQCTPEPGPSFKWMKGFLSMDQDINCVSRMRVSPPQSQTLVHFPSLLRGAEEVGLEYVDIQNLTEFYEDFRVPFAETLQNITLVDAKGHAVVDGKHRLSPVAQDVLSLYTTFIFKKRDPRQRVKASKQPAPPAPTPSSADVKMSKKPSPRFSVATAEEIPLKKQKVSASPAVASTNASPVDVSLEVISSQSDRSATTSSTQTVANTGTELHPERSSMKKRIDASIEPQPEKVSDEKTENEVSNGEFEMGSKSRRDDAAIEHQLEEKSTLKKEIGAPESSDVRKNQRESPAIHGQPLSNKVPKKEIEPAWETKPQRYTLRRAASQGSEVETSQSWSSKGNFSAKIEKDQQGRVPTYNPRLPFNPVSSYATAPRPLRAGERKGPPVHDVAGLLGATPSQCFNPQGDRRFDIVAPPDGSRTFGHSQNDIRVPHPIRGSLYKDRGPGGPLDLPAEGSHPPANNGPGIPWEEHMQNDGRSRTR